MGTRASESQTEEPPTPQDLDEERPTTGRPATRCPKHLDTTTDDVPCRACRACREAAEAWDADQARHAKARASSAARQHAEARALAISVCQLCDNDGYVGRVLCDHDPESAARAARGRQAVAPVLADKPAAQPKRRREPPADEPDLEIESARQRYLEQLAAVGAAEGDPPAGGEP